MESLCSSRTAVVVVPHRGVTIIEMLVVLGIIGVLATVVVTSQTSFNKTILLANTAYDVALSIRSAQTFGLGSRAQGVVTPNAGYGIHFESAIPNTYKLFADKGGTPACHTPASGVPNAPDVIPGDCTYLPARQRDDD